MPLVPPVHLLVIAKSPVAGRVKTRLSPPFRPDAAAALAEAALEDTLHAVRATPALARTVALEGPAGPWLPDGVTVVAQRGRGLDERLAAAFDDAWARVPAPLLLIGMDTPQVTPRLLAECAATLLDGADAVLGLADDGGWWALGLRRPDQSLLVGVPMSTRWTGEVQHRRLQERGLRTAMLPTMLDVDNAEDAITVADLAPSSRFAGRLRMLTVPS